MTRGSFLIIVVLLSAALLSADDGGTYYPENWTYGNIYVKEKNTDISLESELLVVQLRDGEVQAVFNFTNTGNNTVTVPCAFPEDVVIPYTIENGKMQFDWNCIYDQTSLQIALNKTDIGTISQEDISALDKKLRTLTSAAFMTLTGTDDPGMHIVQDGHPVSIKTIGIETSDTGSTISMRIHFYHELVFKPNQKSQVVVTYAVSTKKRDYKYVEYNMKYDISTGGTWKGSIRSFAVVTDGAMDIKGNDEHTHIFEKTNLLGYTAYAVKNYMPAETESFDFQGFDGDGDSFHLKDKGEAVVGQGPYDDYIKDVSASSYLKGQYEFGKDPDEYSYESRVSTYGPMNSFDGVLLNGWVEGVKGDGIGEWIQFTLTENALGPFATNGLARYYQSYNTFDTDWLETWEKNNRIKSMKLENMADKKSSLITFKDVASGIRSTEYCLPNDDWVYINAVKNPQILPAGTYRLSINEVYKGSKWDDTVLGEVWFVPLGKELSQIIFDDDASEKPLFRTTIMGSLNAIIEFPPFEKAFNEALENYKKQDMQL